MGLQQLISTQKTGAFMREQFSGALDLAQHHVEGGFRNFPEIPEREGVPFSFYFERFMEEFKQIPVPADFVVDPGQALLDYSTLRRTGDDAITWIGHSTFMLTIDGVNILIDPFFTNRASPVRWGGPRRYTPPGIAAEALPQVDCILVSHDHYDHLDEDTLRKLPGKENIKVLVPLGLKSFFQDLGYVDIEELDWWQSSVFRQIEFISLPAVHSSGRGARNKNRALWCSWAVLGSDFNCYFAGDTAYSKTVFGKIGRAFDGFNLAIVPIGAYAPRRYMKYSHATPEEAVQIGLETGAERLIPCHWGAIALSSEPYFEPPGRFLKRGVEEGFSAENLWAMKIGETRSLKRKGRHPW